MGTPDSQKWLGLAPPLTRSRGLTYCTITTTRKDFKNAKLIFLRLEFLRSPITLLPNRRATVTLESQKWAAEVADEVLLKRRVVIITAVSLVTELQNVTDLANFKGRVKVDFAICSVTNMTFCNFAWSHWLSFSSPSTGLSPCTTTSPCPPLAWPHRRRNPVFINLSEKTTTFCDYMGFYRDSFANN